MAIKDILTITDYQGKQPAAQVAVEIARLTEAHATGVGLAFEPLLPGFVAAPMPADYLQMAREQALNSAKDSLEAYQKLIDLAGVNGETRVEEILTGGSLEGILSQCRLTDLVAITQDNPEQSEPMRSVIIEALLFDTGVPLLVVPHIFDGQFKPKKAVIAWNGSASAARAVHAALPVLKMVDEVSVLIINEYEIDDREPGAAVATYLARHDLEVSVDIINHPQVSISNTILNYISDNGADLLVMGGYGHSRMREMLLGGATREILANMTVPVLMTH
ncbi:universal stress protein [Rhodobacteraceae bacterium RKSG542]|uniref:universal stress protein n=1 Tax=Pseudovibrio flavus TaxID=2529854 RepID=UPI0012BCA040|nr:universal stress protein [Pseudovibrio flavus]MTI15838.1 universal stress protein [Pseudovibrio flavus]